MIAYRFKTVPTRPLEPVKEPHVEPRLTAADIRKTLEIAFPQRLTIRDIQDEVAQFYGINPDYMRDPDGIGRREPRVSHPRQMAMFMSREFTEFSLPDIGRLFGGRDHTTVMYALKAVKQRSRKDPYVDLEIEVLREKFAEKAQHIACEKNHTHDKMCFVGFAVQDHSDAGKVAA